ncbi:MAG: hypothetical protein U0793_22570 [Gemmataceae bacterium]
MQDDQPHPLDQEIASYVEKYGAVPPPWIAVPDTHPYDICWRMGAGEGYLDVFRRWWDSQNLEEPERIGYFRKWPPPPRWLAWLIGAIWGIEPEEDEEVEDAAYAPYFARLEALGFGSRAEYEKDLDDPKWLGSRPREET